MINKLSKATHQGILKIGNKELNCAVLADGTRLLTQAAVFQSFGRPPRGRRSGQSEDMINLPSFVDAKNLLPYINEEVSDVIKPMEYINEQGKVSKGYKAEILPVICGVYLDAKRDKVLRETQIPLADVSEMMLRALSKVGIIALVDEATGYQEIRDRKALAAILDKYLRKELAAWAKRFPDEFYKEMFRLRGWNWSYLKRPGYVGKLTNDVVYERITPGLLEELNKRSPKNEDGKRKGTLQQLFTDDIGHPALAQHLHAVTGLMRAAGNWDGFYRLLQRAFPKKNDQLSLLIED